MSETLSITLRNGLGRAELLDLRDEMIDALAPLGIELEMTVSGTEVFLRHAPTTRHMMAEFSRMVELPPCGCRGDECFHELHPQLERQRHCRKRGE